MSNDKGFSVAADEKGWSLLGPENQLLIWVERSNHLGNSDQGIVSSLIAAAGYILAAQKAHVYISSP